MAGNDWKRLEMAGKGLKIYENPLYMAENGFEWVGNGFQWLNMGVDDNFFLMLETA